MANKKIEEIDTVQKKEPDSTDKKIENDLAKLFEMVSALQDELKSKNELLGTKDILIETLQSSKQSQKKMKVVNLSGIRVDLKLGNGKNIVIERVGEEYSIKEEDALELVNRYRGFFAKGMITLIGDGSKEILEYANLETDVLAKTGILGYKDCLKLGLVELEKYYRNLLPAQKELIRLFWYEEAAVDNPDALDVSKIELLNRLSDGRFEYLLKRKILKIEED